MENISWEVESGCPGKAGTVRDQLPQAGKPPPPARHRPWPGGRSTPIVSATFHFNLNPFPVCEPLVLSPLAHADLTSRLLEPAGLSHHRLGPLLTAEHSFLCHQSCPQHCFLLFLLPGMETASRVLVSWGRQRLQKLSRYCIHWSEGRGRRAESSRDPNSSPREAHKNEI